MTNKVKSLQTVENNQKAISFTEKQVELIKNTIAVGATDDELKLFLYQAQRSGLDPLARQIYFLKRNVKNKNGTWESKATIQTSIDGFRVVAERSGNYAGQDEPVFEEASNYPKLCKVAVYKFSPNGQRYQASVGVAYWEEYCPPDGQNFMWKKMPHTMLAKVAESLALRKAFPQDLSGLYTQEEMSQDENSNTHEKPQNGFHDEGDYETEPVEVTEINAPQKPLQSVIEDVPSNVLNTDNPNFEKYANWSRAKVLLEVMGLKQKGIIKRETSELSKMDKEDLIRLLESA